MLALVRAHVDQLGCSPHRVHRRFNNPFRRRDKSNHGAIVIRIDVRVEHARRFNSGDRSAISRTVSGFRPSLKFGTHSTKCMCLVL